VELFKMPATSHSMQCSSNRSRSRIMGGVHCLARPHRPLRRMLQSTKALQPCRKDEHSMADDRIHAVWTVATRHPRAAAVAATPRAATLQFACMPLRGERRRSLSANFDGSIGMHCVCSNEIVLLNSCFSARRGTSWKVAPDGRMPPTTRQ